MKPLHAPLNPDDDDVPPVDPYSLASHEPKHIPPLKLSPLAEFMAQGTSHRMYASKVVLDDGIHDAVTMLTRLVRNQGSWDIVTVFKLPGDGRIPEHFNRLGKKIAELQAALGFDIAEVKDLREIDNKFCRVRIRRNLKGSSKYKVLEIMAPESLPSSNGDEPQQQQEQEQAPQEQGQGDE